MIISPILQYFITIMISPCPAMLPDFDSKQLQVSSFEALCKTYFFLLQLFLLPLFCFTLHNLCSHFTITIITIFHRLEIIQRCWSYDGFLF